MDKKIRNFLIVIFGIIFILAIPTVILYSQGYRFDFETKKIIKTGGFAFKTYPKSCEIYLNDKFVKKTDFIFGEVFIKNLLPKKYNVKIKKQGLLTWEKNLEVREKMVTEAKNVILFPEKPNFSLLFSDIENYYFSPDGNKIILEKNLDSNRELSVLNLENNHESLILEEADLNKKGFEISDLKWSPDSKKILLEAKTKEKIEYFIIDILKETDNYIFPIDYATSPKKILFNNRDSQEIFFLEENKAGITGLIKSNYYKKSLSKLPIGNVEAYGLFNENIFWLSKEGFLSKADLSGASSEILNKEPLPIDQDLEYEIKILSDQKIFLNNKNGLYFLNLETKNFEKILNSVKSFELSADSKNIYFSDNYEIWLFDESLKKIVFLTRFSKKLGNIFWLNSDYLIFNSEEKIKISEIDTRDKINAVEIGNFENPKIFWSKSYKNLYILSKGNFYSLGNLIP
jgi:hypothetical protein